MQIREDFALTHSNPTNESQQTQVPKEIDAKAVGYAKEFLRLIGEPSDDVAVNSVSIVIYRQHRPACK
jgi:hypothetical protein